MPEGLSTNAFHELPRYTLVLIDHSYTATSSTSASTADSLQSPTAYCFGFETRCVEHVNVTVPWRLCGQLFGEIHRVNS